MQKCSFRLAALWGVALTFHSVHAQFATSVISYNAGTGSASGFNNPSAALGQPSTFTNDPNFPSPVDPFDPPFLPEQIVSIGAGGSLTVQFASPILNDASHPFGVDFMIFGNSGFVEDFNSFKATGDLFSNSAPGSTRVSVSADNVTYFTLDTSRAPTVDSMFPTDGSGLFYVPVNPALGNPASFANMTLDQIRAAYAGSAGGAGFDLGWAQDGNGNPVALNSVSYVRVDVLSGATEVEGFSAVPEPSTCALIGIGAAAAVIRKRRA